MGATFGVKLTVFGATEPIGLELIEQAVGRGHEVTAVVTGPTEDGSFDRSVRMIEASPYTGENVDLAVAEATAVCNVLRQSGSKPPDFLTVAGDEILRTMEAAGVERYLTVAPAAAQDRSAATQDRSAAARDGSGPTGIGESIVSTIYRLLYPSVIADAGEHVERVRARDLDWTVVRTPRLSDGERTRQYRTGAIKLGIGSVSYGDVAAFLLDCLEREIYVQREPKIRTP